MSDIKGPLCEQFKFEVKYATGEFEVVECEAGSWKDAWAKLGDHIQSKANGVEHFNVVVGLH